LRKVDSCTTQVATRRHTRRRTPWITDSTPSALTHAARARRTPPTGVDTVFGTTSCPCGQGHGETVEHTFWKCDRSYLVWESITRFWRTATGEHGVTATDGRLVLFGDRSATWGSEADWAEWAGLEEPFAILHKATLHVLFLERERDAAQPHKPRRTPTQVVQRIRQYVQRVAEARWSAARRSGAVEKFERVWIGSGLATLRKDQSVMVTMLLSTAQRRKRQPPAPNARAFRAQQYAPPHPPPRGMVHIYIAGVADARKKKGPRPPIAL
jgi:hypothetical protein